MNQSWDDQAPLSARAFCRQKPTAALNKIQAHPELLKLTALVGSQGIANWDAELAADPGVTISVDSKRVLSQRNRQCKSASIWRVRADPGRQAGSARWQALQWIPACCCVPRLAKPTVRSDVSQSGMGAEFA